MSFEPKNIVVIGCSGAIGEAFIEKMSNLYSDAEIHGFSRNSIAKVHSNVNFNKLNYYSEKDLENAALIASKNAPIDVVIVATGILHDNDLMPEKSLKDISMSKFQKLFEANVIMPTLIFKYFLPKLNRNSRSVFATLSARVGSISDNQLGGWYSYRASKAALNMVIKNSAIEVARKNKNAVIIGLHPGTVDSYLSKPFQSGIVHSKLFSPEFSVEKMIEVLHSLIPSQSGKCFAWDGSEILP